VARGQLAAIEEHGHSIASSACRPRTPRVGALARGDQKLGIHGTNPSAKPNYARTATGYVLSVTNVSRHFWLHILLR
jgi:hypothetical protein